MGPAVNIKPMDEAPAGAAVGGLDERAGRLQFLLRPPFWLRGRGFYILLALLFFFAAVVQTWPLVLHASDSIINLPHRPEDSWAYLWNIWWVKDATLHLENPLETDSVFYPQGAELYMHALTTVNGVMSIPLQVLTGNVILSWNILSLILFVLSGLTTYALANHVSGSRGGALVAAYVFTFSPFVMMRLHGGHWNVSTVWMLPLFALFVVLFRETGRWRHAVGTGVMWALIAYNSMEYATDAALFLALFFVYWSVVYAKDHDLPLLRRLWLGAPIIIGVWFTVGAPLLIPAIDSGLNNEVSVPPGPSNLFTDLRALVTPSPLWGPGELPSPVPDGSKHFPTGDLENTVYLGITPLLLAAVAIGTIRSVRHPAVFWAIVCAFFIGLALGPHLFIGDTKDFSILGMEFSVPLPYQIYERLPFLEDRRGISRLIVFGHLALAVLAAIGLRRVLAWIPPNYARLAPAVALVALLLVAVEYWTPPNVVNEQPTAAAIEAIKDEPGDFAVIHAPIGRSTWTVGGTQAGAYLADYYARIHEKRTFGGYLSRAPDGSVFWIMLQPGIKYLSCPSCPNLPALDDLDSDLVRDTLRRYRVRYVVLHRLMPGGGPVGGLELARLANYLSTVAGMTVEHEEPAFTIYRNPEVPR